MNFDLVCNWEGRQAEMTMTSVMGHLMGHDFVGEFKSWRNHPPCMLFDAPIHRFVVERSKDVALNLEQEARRAQVLVIWTDCDREGENIGKEIVEVCQKVNPRLRVLRAHFSSVQPREIHNAMRNLVPLNMRLSDAVDARIELDLRIGAAFTRLQTLNFKHRFDELSENTLSYGPCQFPTLGFVVEQYWRRERFIPCDFWYISTAVKKDNQEIQFNWQRQRLYDRLCCLIRYERCVDNPMVTVTEVSTKPSKIWRPLPLTTVALQKAGTSLLRMTSEEVMTVAESLYNKGFLSYPRTETDQFDSGFNLKELIQKQTEDPRWGDYAQNLLDGAYRFPRRGQNNDKAHPPIHPTKAATALEGNEKRVYEYVTRLFLACCSDDAITSTSSITVRIDREFFGTGGVQILQRNFLDVFTYQNAGSRILPTFTVGEQLMPCALEMNQGRTSPPNLLTEAALIGTMDQNGIGTDATIAEHIKKIQERRYASKEGNYFVPTTLGLALVEGFDEIGFDDSLAKPVLRRKTEQQLKQICDGIVNKANVVQENVRLYREMFEKASGDLQKIEAALTKYFGHGPNGNAPAVEYRNDTEMSRPIRSCFKCSASMVARTKKDGGWLIRCQGYPACKEVIWLPQSVKRITVSPDDCQRCARNNIVVSLVTFTFDPMNIPPTLTPEYTCCINCDDNIKEFLDIRSGPSLPPLTAENTTNINRQTTNYRAIDNNIDLMARHPQSIRTNDQIVADNLDNDPSAPSCSCNQPAQRKKVTKQNQNHGREFYGCASRVCDFFAWCDGQETSFSNQPPRYGQPPGVSSFHTPIAKPKCDCDLYATLKTSSKGEHSGRQFWSCTKVSRGKCKFFQWADEQQPQTSRGSGSDVTCFACGQAGHFASQCPSRGTESSSTSRAKKNASRSADVTTSTRGRKRKKKYED